MENKTYKDMKAIDFLKELNRMCCGDCSNCDAYDDVESKCKVTLTGDCTEEEYDKAIEIVYDWSKKHPVKTMADVLFEAFPQAEKDEGGTPNICPVTIVKNYEGFVKNYDCEYEGKNGCKSCKKEFWNSKAPEK